MLLMLALGLPSGAWAKEPTKATPQKPAKVSHNALTQAIKRAAKAYDVDPRALAAIAYLESSGGKFVGLRHNRNGTWDVGAFQINSIHWDTTCAAYNVHVLKGNAMCAAKLLRSHRRHRDSDPHWRGRYHSKTPSRKQVYATKLEKIMTQIGAEK